MGRTENRTNESGAKGPGSLDELRTEERGTIKEVEPEARQRPCALMLAGKLAQSVDGHQTEGYDCNFTNISPCPVPTAHERNVV